jgi:hypothetical protein
MSTTIEQYRDAKSQYLKLKGQAKKELVARFNALANELLQVQRELLEDFGEKVTLPAKPSAAKKPKPSAAAPASAASAASGTAPNQANAAKITALTKQLDKQKKKLDELKAAGKPAKAVEDRIYELEDEIRLLQ